MWNNGYGYGMGTFGFGPMGFGVGIVFALLVINTFGILEILYLYVFSKHHSNSSSSK